MKTGGNIKREAKYNDWNDTKISVEHFNYPSRKKLKSYNTTIGKLNLGLTYGEIDKMIKEKGGTFWVNGGEYMTVTLIKTGENIPEIKRGDGGIKENTSLNNKKMKISLLKKIIKEEIDNIDRKENLILLAHDLDAIQNQYEDILSDEDLDMLSNFISQIHQKANSL